MAIVWVVVADRQRARIFEARAEPPSLAELDDLVHLESREHERDLGADKPGRISATSGGRHGLSPAHSIKEQEAVYFARQVAKYLTHAHDQHRFERIVLCASPRFLGLLRDAVPKAVHDCVTHELAKDLVHIEQADEIRRHLPDRL